MIVNSSEKLFLWVIIPQREIVGFSSLNQTNSSEKLDTVPLRLQRMENKKPSYVKSDLKHSWYCQWSSWTSSCFVHQVRVSILPKETMRWLKKRESPIYPTVIFSQLAWLNRGEAWAHVVTITTIRKCSSNSNGRLFKWFPSWILCSHTPK